MYKKFEINRTKIKGGCQLGRKVVTHNSMSDLPLVCRYVLNLEDIRCEKVMRYHIYHTDESTAFFLIS